MSSVEDEMWWYAGLHANLIAALQRRLGSRSGGALLDAGCGTGGLLRKFSRAFGDFILVGIDADEGACRCAADKSSRLLCKGSVNSLPFAEAAFVAVVCADVLYHRNVDERRTLDELHRCLVSQGVLVVNVPAYQWMYSNHDRAVHTARRYTRSRLHAALQAAGFVDIQTSYWNMILFPFMALRRKLLSGNETNDVRLYPKIIERAFRNVMRLENMLLRHGATLPYGGSILATALKA